MCSSTNLEFQNCSLTLSRRFYLFLWYGLVHNIQKQPYVFPYPSPQWGVPLVCNFYIFLTMIFRKAGFPFAELFLRTEHFFPRWKNTSDWLNIIFRENFQWVEIQLNASNGNWLFICKVIDICLLKQTNCWQE